MSFKSSYWPWISGRAKMISYLLEDFIEYMNSGHEMMIINVVQSYVN